MNNMEKYNLVTQKNNIIPNYEIDKKDITFEIYISPEKECCILGRLDNNYICWCSMTSIAQRETNVAIFNHLLKLNQKMISSEGYALGTRYHEVMGWHILRITKEVYENEYRYFSPASRTFFKINETNGGDFLSEEISRFYNFELAKCEYRLIDLSYKIILEKYKTLLTQKSDYGYYNEMKPIRAILENESYIKLSLNEGIRNLYLECIEECSNLYNRYMSAIH
ncbi:hypothetical protein KPL55_14420 [Clostridium lacusfryxellense]|nr:hypothetical protein [Clostridium lacusfryxellense]